MLPCTGAHALSQEEVLVSAAKLYQERITELARAKACWTAIQPSSRGPGASCNAWANKPGATIPPRLSMVVGNPRQQ
ncbi:hypothetical protein LP420_06165 [Massilia sp. B-10]|nr:hypothetical protein LP420_06165 [Massilia sp. B-10]